ncbi:HAD family hydrolase [Elysia marginata]|uniref:HAD family hydrolase n=1 Tax=Elysia marginata TaxID=1093978 RepID=A0AAV4HKC9_9GAST|nr:HAD family hydrolase [Elysia marginata]
MKNKIKTIIFDLGGVLIDWNPEYVYLNEFGGDREKMQWFFDNICTPEWNEEQDAGRPLKEATEERIKKFPKYKEWIEMYYGRWIEMLGGSIEETVEVLKSLIDSKLYQVLALTNWSAETFPMALERFDFLHWFEGIVISGEEKMKKPSKEIYQLTLDRFSALPEASLFIDDRQINIEAANTLGLNTILFESAEQLREELKAFISN